MSYQDSNTSGRYGNRDDDTYGSGRPDSGYAGGTSTGDYNKPGTTTSYGDETGTNIRDQTYSSDPGYGDRTGTNIRDQTTSGIGSTAEDEYGENTRTNIRDKATTNVGSGYGDDTDDYSAGNVNRRVADAPQQATSNEYSKDPPSHTGGGLGQEDNATTSAAATGGADNAGRDMYGMGSGRTYDQEVGGIGGRPQRFTEAKFRGDDDPSDTTGSRGDGSGYDYGMGDPERSGYGDKQDSTTGKLMQKAGSLLHNKNLERKGEEARRDAGAYDNSGSGNY